MRKSLAAVAGIAAATLTLVAPAPASAAAAPKVTVVSSAVITPFNLDVSTGKVLVADSAAGAVVKVGRDGSVTTVAETDGPEGVAVSRDGRYLAHTTLVGGPEGITASGLVIIGPKGKRVTADTLAYERANNPDQKLTYGVDNPDACVTEALESLDFPVKYTGGIDSHAYSVAAYGKKFVVADAGGNDLLMVDRKGTISTIGVLPRHPRGSRPGSPRAWDWRTA